MAGLVFYGTTGKFTWRMLATVLAGQSIVVFFGALVARAMAATGSDVERAGTYLAVGTGLAVLCLLAAGTLRRPWGITLGWVVQLATLLSALVVPMMVVVSVVFLALWVVSLVQGRRVDTMMAQREAEEPGETGPEGAPEGPDRVGE
jgi:hypothetical protein